MKFLLLNHQTLHGSLGIEEATHKFLLVQLLSVTKYIGSLLDDSELIFSHTYHLLAVDVVFILQVHPLLILSFNLDVLCRKKHFKPDYFVDLTLATSALFELVNCHRVPSTRM